MRIKLFILLGFMSYAPFFVQAQTGRIEKTKENKAVVVFPANQRVLVGAKVIVQDEFSEPLGGKRKREHVLSWEITNSTTKGTTTVNSSSSSSESKKSKYSLRYLYNMGSFELGAGVSKTVEETSSQTDGTEISFTGQYDFIENTSDNDLIPYIFANYSMLSGKTGSVSISGNGLVYGAGLIWFPFSEIFAVDVSVGTGSANVKLDSTPQATLKMENTTFSIGWRIYF